MPDRPQVDGHLESLDRPGVFVAGDLTGVPLIRNAIDQGALVADRIAATLPRGQRASSGDAAAADLVVVGAGPAGLSAALRAGERGLRCVVLEQSGVAASIRAFPRHKIVHDPPLELPLVGPLWLRESTKEELVAQWTRIVREHRVDVREGHRVTEVARDAGSLLVRADGPGGPVVLRAARVLLATGRRGTPRALDAEIAPDAASRVASSLSDARALAGRKVLVVGLGDSALEAVVALARQPGTTVTVSYRGEGFARGRARNMDAVRRLVEAGRVRIVFGSTVTRVEARGALLRTGDGTGEKVAVDQVLALLGGEPSRALLQAAGLVLETVDPLPCTYVSRECSCARSPCWRPWGPRSRPPARCSCPSRRLAEAARSPSSPPAPRPPAPPTRTSSTAARCCSTAVSATPRSSATHAGGPPRPSCWPR